MRSPFVIFGIIFPAIIVAVDQWTKQLVIKHFNVDYNICEQTLYPDKHSDFSPIFDLSLVCNPGISFGLLGGDSSFKRWALTLFAVFMCGALLYFLRKTEDMISRIGISLIIGGAIGNGIDRALNGAVTDFIDVTSWLPFFKWAFNVADSAITCGVIILFIGTWLTERRLKS